MQNKFFGTSGIRAVVNEQLTTTLALQIGLAIAAHTSRGKALVARDTRTSGPMLQNAVTAGLLAGGSNVYKLGLLPTPVLAFLTKELKADAGIMITASHNPPEYNGIKLFNRNSAPYNQTQQSQIEEIVGKHRFKRATWRNVGVSATLDETRRYTEMVQGTARLKKAWKVVLDPGCGATCYIAPEIFRKLGCKVTAINAQPDGSFPARKPLPDSGSLHPLSQTVQRLHADVGIGYDGDGDRMAAVDEKGAFAPFDRILAAYAAYIAKRHEGQKVVTNVEASMCFEKAVESHGGRVARTKVGDVNLTEAIKEHGAVFGGEPCGAWIHPEHHYCPDGILSSVLLLQALEEEDKTLSSFISGVPRYHILREKLACPDEIKSKVMKKLEEALPSIFSDIEEELTIDGVRLKLKDAWVLIRPSGTEPLIRVTAEAALEEEVREIMERSVKVTRKLVEEAAT